jgi:hypothetical protein
MGALIAILTFLVVVVVFLGIWIFASAEGTQEQVRKRMSAVHKAERRGDVGVGLKLVRDEMLSNVPWMHQLMMRWSWRAWSPTSSPVIFFCTFIWRCRSESQLP